MLKKYTCHYKICKMQENLFCFCFFLQMLRTGIIIVCMKKEIQHKNEFYNWVVKKKV